MPWSIRPYTPNDYDGVKALYLNGDTFGGQFDMARDAPDRLASVIAARPDAIWVAEQNGAIIGTVSLVDDGRIAWLYRFAVVSGPDALAITRELYSVGCKILRDRGHKEVLVYSPVGNASLDARYKDFGMTQGGAYTCYWTKL